MCRVGQNHIYTVCIQYFWQGDPQKYDQIRCIYTVLANPIYVGVRPRSGSCARMSLSIGHWLYYRFAASSLRVVNKIFQGSLYATLKRKLGTSD